MHGRYQAGGVGVPERCRAPDAGADTGGVAADRTGCMHPVRAAGGCGHAVAWGGRRRLTAAVVLVGGAALLRAGRISARGGGARAARRGLRPRTGRPERPHDGRAGRDRGDQGPALQRPRRPHDPDAGRPGQTAAAMAPGQAGRADLPHHSAGRGHSQPGTLHGRPHLSGRTARPTHNDQRKQRHSRHPRPRDGPPGPRGVNALYPEGARAARPAGARAARGLTRGGTMAGHAAGALYARAISPHAPARVGAGGCGRAGGHNYCAKVKFRERPWPWPGPIVSGPQAGNYSRNYTFANPREGGP